MKITFIGTGTSTGVPSVGCNCEVCRSTDPKDKRLRCAAIVEVEETTLLIDCGPDLRQQTLNYYPSKLDGVLITHEHFDHVGGLDDLRPFCYHKALNLYAEHYMLELLKQRVPYCFRENRYPGVPNFNLKEVTMSPFTIGRCEIQPIRVMHYKLPILGYRINNMAYMTDVKDLPEEEYDKLKGLDTLIINALRIKEHLSHQNLEQALEKIARIAPKKAYLIHMSHEMGLHAVIEKQLPEGVSLAYDGLVVESH